MTDRELMQQALEALERCVATCFHAYAHEQVMSRPEHFVNQNIAALRERLAKPEQWEQLYSGMGNPFKRPPNCGTSFCSCIECVMEPETRPATREEKMEKNA